MHTAEIEHHPLAKRFPFLRSEDTAIATIASWTVGLLIFTLAGFYFGTIAGHDNHPESLPNATESIRVSQGGPGMPWREAGRALHKDLDTSQLAHALPFAAVGLLIGLMFALWITFGYTPAKLRELASEQSGH